MRRASTHARLLTRRPLSPPQYANPDNAGSHVLSTGPELLEQMGGDIDALILPISTGGQVGPPAPLLRLDARLRRHAAAAHAVATCPPPLGAPLHLGPRPRCLLPPRPALTPSRASPQIDGIGRFVKEHMPSCTLIGTEPIGSTILASEPGDYYNAGSGLDYAPKPVEKMLADGLIDEGWTVPDAASFKAQRILAKTTGALMGPTTGMQVFAALALAIENPGMGNIAVVGCDDGRAYVPDM